MLKKIHDTTFFFRFYFQKLKYFFWHLCFKTYISKGVIDIWLELRIVNSAIKWWTMHVTTHKVTLYQRKWDWEILNRKCYNASDESSFYGSAHVRWHKHQIRCRRWIQPLLQISYLKQHSNKEYSLLLSLDFTK